MNNKETILHQLIELYFEGMTTLEQERQLRSMLADGRLRSPEAEEARAVLGVSAMMPMPQKAATRLAPLYRVAAVAVLLLVVGLLAGHFSGGPTDTKSPDCFAYVGTELVEDPEIVMSMMQTQLSDMSAVADEVSRDLEESIAIIKTSEQ